MNNTIKTVCASTATLTLIGSLVGEANAALILDQRTVAVVEDGNPPSAVGLVEENREIEIAQTVTVGVSGYLSQVDVWMSRQLDSSVSFMLTVLGGGNTPNTQSLLASFSVSADTITPYSDLRTFSLVSINTRNENLYFNSGDVISIALSAPDEPMSVIAPYWAPYSWNTENPGQYSQGSRYSRELQNGTEWTESNIVDQALQTWVDPIPEPSSSLLLGFGALGIAARRRRTN